MTRPLVSVCMPTYNYAHYLEEAIRSVYAQTYRPLELVVVDDGSTDNTTAVLEAVVANAPIPVKVVMGDHRGVAATLNKALKSSSGEWICILAADDIATPDRVQKQVNAIEEGTVMVHSEYVCIDSKGARLAYDSSTDLPPARGEALRALLLLQADVRSMTVMIRRAALEAQPYDESLPSEDWQSILRLSKIGRIAHVPEALVLRRVHLGSASFTGHRNKTTFSFKEIGLDVLREVTPADLPLDRVCAIHTSVVLRNALALGAFRKVKDGFRQSFEEFPDQRAFIVAETLKAVPSYFWTHGLRERMPESALKALLRLKAAAISLRATKA